MPDNDSHKIPIPKVMTVAEFDYRANRRWSEHGLFDRLVLAAVSAKPLTFKQLTTGAT